MDKIKTWFKNLNFKTYLPILIALFAVFVSIWQGYTANKIARQAMTESKNLSKKLVTLEERALEQTAKFSIISAEAIWAEQLIKYKEVDHQIQIIEKDMKLNRKGNVLVKVERDQLIPYLKKLHLADKAITKYILRHELYVSLENIAQQYEPFKDRIKGMSFELPAYPKKLKRARVLVIGGRSGISMGGSRIMTIGGAPGIGIQ